MDVTETERQRIIRGVLNAYKGSKQVRITTHRVEVQIIVRYDNAGQPLLTGWFDCGSPEYWLAHTADVPLYPSM